ncbi:MAG: nucleotide exchange factor GrpE [Arenicellales bacterium]|jgi:molecular chaperone GrpE|nr:nucleotide exchange factor GrpE [Arenicellales bacterium]
MTAVRPENPTDDVQEEAMSEPLEAAADASATAPAPGEAQDGEAREDDDTPAALDDIDVLRTENAQLRNEFLRAHADAENARKRAQTEISNARRFALEGFASELLNVRDSLDLARSVDLEGAEGVVERVVEGLELTLRQLDSAFERFSVFEISPEVGDKLDPESHQAMTLAPSGEVEPNHICQVIQKGYRLHDRLLRPARVIVAKAPDDDDRDEKPVSGA